MGMVKQDDGWRLPGRLWAQMEPLLPPRKPPPLGCHNPRSDTFEMARFDEKAKDCKAWHNVSLEKKPAYEMALKGHERLDEQLQLKFEKVTGMAFSDKLYQINKQKAEYARLQNWNR
jgi:hypothetical protein